MKTHDFRKGKRGPVLPLPPGKERITIRLDTDILEYFRDAVERAGGGNYQTLIVRVRAACNAGPDDGVSIASFSTGNHGL